MGNVLAELFQDIADSIKAKTGIDEKMKPLSFPERIQAMDVASGADEINLLLDQINGEVINGKIVSFVGLDGTVLCQVSVVPGFDCPNPVTTKLISTPKKESTVDTVYTFSGWSLTEDGAADADALKNVTEDRSVYVVFKASVRYYQVSFYDDTNAYITTINVPYGGFSAYTAKKTGAYFLYWTPEPVNVTGDMKCYGTWEYASFAADSWEQIVANARKQQADEYYSVGDERDLTLTYADGTTETTVLQVAQPDASGIPVSVYFVDEIEDVETATSKEQGSAGICILAKFPLAGSYMSFYEKADNHFVGTIYNNDGYFGSSVFEYLHDVVFPALPADLREVLPVAQIPYTHSAGAIGPYLAFDRYCKLWIPSAKELGADAGETAHDYEGYELPLFLGDFGLSNKSKRVRTLANGTTVPYWTRSTIGGASVFFADEEGDVSTNISSYEGKAYVIFGFYL